MDLLTSFKNYLFSQEVQPSKVTVKNYLSDINHFVNWFSQKYNSSFTPGQVNFQTLEEYKKDNSSVFSASSMQRHLSSLRKFFKFLKIENQITFDPFEALALNKPEEKDYWKLKDFKSSLFDTNAAHLTIKNYIIDVKQFINWAKEATGLEDSILPGRISKEFIEEYKTALSSSKGFSPASVNRKLSSLRKYLTWADEAGILTEKVLDFTNINEAKQKLFIPETPEFSQPEIKTKTYSRFPPLRLAQKLSQGLILALDAALILPLASFAKKGQDLAWTLKGKPIFHKNPQTFQIKNITHKDLLGIRNISKKVFAPSTIAVSSLSPLQRIIFHARFTRPNWYKRYHSYAITHYFHFAVFIIVIVAISLGFYNSFFGNQSKITAAPNLPTSPNRILSFQGRLTDNNDNPITSLTNLRFAIYTQQTPGTGAGILLWQEVDKVTPDQDGIFNTLLGSGPTCANPIAIATGQCAIPSTLFAENAALFLGVTVESTGELTPRQQIATVGYAANSETLQGLLPITATAAGTSNVVLALDSSGNLTIGGSASPAFSASGGQFKLSGQPLLLTTNDSSNSNVVISPNGTGKIDVQKPLQNNTLSTNIRSAAGAFTAAGAVEVNDQFAILATSSGQSAFTVNQNSTGPVISASVSGAPVFTVDNGGNQTNSGDISVGGATGIVLSGTGADLRFSGSGNHDIYASAGTLQLGSATLIGTLTTSFTGNNRVLYADSATGALSAVTGSSGLCLVSGATTPTWGSCASGLPTDWWTTSSDGKALTPINSTMDFLLGGTATATAKFAVLGLNGTGPATATVAGNLIVMPKNGAGGNVGIGTTNPLARLQVNSTGDGTLFRLQRAGGSNLPIFQYNFTEATNIIEQEITGASAPTLTWKLGGSEQMRITPNGRLGIGTTSPTAILDVDGAASVGGQFTFRNGTAQIQSTANQQLTIGGNTTGNIILSPLNNSGYVGIGTTTPISLLSAFRDITDVANIGRSTTQNVGIGGTAGGNFLTSYSATNNAKSLIINATTDSSNTAPSAGTNGIVFQIRGGTSFAIDDNGDSRFYNDVTIDDTLTVGSTASIAGNLTLSGGARSIQTTTNNNLTLGGNTTGNIWLMPRNGAGTVYGDTAANGNLTLEGTSHATKTTSYLLLQPNGGNVGIGDSTPSKLFVVGNGDLFQVDSNGNALAPTLALGNGTIARTDRLFDINDSNSDINAKTYTGTVQRTITGTINANRTDYGLYNYVTTTASDDMFSHTAIAGYNVSQLNNGYTIDTSYGTQGYSLISSSTLSSFGNTATTSAGTYGIANLNAAGTVTSNMGIYGIAQNSNAGGTVTNNDGGRFISYATTDGATITTSRGIYAQSYENGDYASNGIVTGYGGYFDSQDADTTYGIWARGLQSSGLSETFTNTYGIWSQCQAASAGTTITNCYGITSLISASNATATITNAYGIHIQNPTSTGTIVNNHGLYIQDQTGGDTNDYGITIAGADTQVLWLSSGADNTDAANGIAFGASRDTNLYRSAADTLKTDDKLAIGTLNSGASNPLCYDGSNILSTCAAGALGTNWWTTSTDGKALTPINNTMDLLVGGNSTSSAQFAVLNIAGTLTPIASVSATAGSDATKGIYLSGNGSLQSVRNNTLTIGGSTTGNIALMPRNGNGNVGIGTSSPTEPLDISGSSTNPIYARVVNTSSGGSGFLVANSTGTNTGRFYWDNNNAKLVIGTITNNPVSFFLNNSEIARFDTSGNLGINTTTPTAKLDINGDASTSGSLVFNGSNKSIDILNGSRLDFQVSPGGDAGLTNAMTIAGNGNVGIGTTNPGTSKLNVQGGAMQQYLASGNNQGLWLHGGDTSNNYVRTENTTGNFDFGQGNNSAFITSANDPLSINVNGSTAMYFPSAGNVGIGTTGPDRALEINSATGVNLRLTYNDNNGSATNYADLVTNSGGDLSINPSGGDLITSGAFTSQNGNIYAGVNDTTGGLFHAYGNGTGSSEGGEVILYTAADYDTTVNAYNLDAYQDDFRIYQGSNTRLTITNTGLVGLGVGNTVPTSQLYVSRPLASGATGKALSIFDQIENQDIFTASASGTPVFTITRAGGISLGSNGLNYGTGSQCIAGGATASWVNCALGTNWWTTSTDGKALTPINNTMDLLVGGNSTSSAQFAVLNIAGTLTPIASVSATAGSDATKGIYLSGNGSLQSVRNNTLTIGGSTTGNINLSPSNGSGFVNISGGLGASGIIAGKNILPYQYASWETGVDGTNIPSARNVNVTSVTISTADAYDGTRSVAVSTNGSATDGYAYLNGTSSTSYNIPIKPSTKYAFSVYSKLSAGTTCSVEMYVRESDGTHRSAGGTADTSSWTRLSNTFTSNSGSTAVIIRVDANCASTTALFDGFMLEEIPTSQTYASAWSSNGNFGIRMDQNNLLGLDGSASVSGNLVLEGASRSIQSYDQNTLTIGGSTTGNITLLPNNGTGGLINNNGYIAANGNTTITGSPLTVGTNLGWKVGLWSNSFALGIANSTLAVKTGTWLSIFGSSNPANNATNSTPDTNSNINFNATTGDASISGSLVFQSASNQTIDILNGSRLDFQTSPGGDAGLTNAMTIAGNGRVGIGTTNPTAKFQVTGTSGAGGTGDFITNLQGGSVTESDLYILNSRDVNTGVGYAAKVIGVNVQNAVGAANEVYLRSNNGGITSAGAIYLGADDVNQGVFGVLGTPISSAPGTALTHLLTVKGNGNVGIGTTAPDRALEINSATGNNLRLTYNDNNGSATNYADLTTNSGGDLTINPSGSNVVIGSGNYLSVGGTTQVGQITGITSATNPSNGIDTFALTASGSYGGGIGLADGTGNFGIWTDTTGTVARFGFGTSLGALTSYMSLTNAGALTIADDFRVNGNDILDSAGTSRLTLGATTTLTNTGLTFSGTTGITASSLTSMTTGAAFTLNGTSYVRVGDTATPGTATGDDDLFVEGDLEVDGVLYTDGGIDTALTPGSVVFAGTSGVLSQDNASLFYDDTNDSLGIGTAAPGSTTRLSVAKTWGSATATEQFGIYSTINYSAADTGLKQNLRLNTGATHTTGTQANLIGLLSLVTGAGNGGTTTNAYGLWSRIDSATGHTVTNGINYGINNGTVTGTLTNQMGIQVGGLTTGTNNAGILIGEATGTNQSNLVIGSTSIPTGTYSIYNSSTDQNYFAGNVGISTTGPLTKLHVAGGSTTPAGELGSSLITGSTTAMRLAMGVDNTSTMYSWIQSVENGSTQRALSLNPIGGNVGIGTTAPDRALEINSSGGTNLRLTYNDSNGSATNYADLTTNSGGDLTIDPSGGQVVLNNTGDSSLATALSGALILGDTAGDNITMDGNEIMARTAGTTASTLFLNAEGGLVSVGAGGLTSTGTLTANGTLDANGIFTLGDGGETGAITTSDWAIDTTGNITNIGNISNTANASQPYLVLDSVGTGDDWTAQGAYISIGEGGALGSASMHITYTGNGYGYTGAGTVTSGIPAGGYWRYTYNTQNIYTPGSVQIGSNLDVDGNLNVTGLTYAANDFAVASHSAIPAPYNNTNMLANPSFETFAGGLGIADNWNSAGTGTRGRIANQSANHDGAWGLYLTNTGSDTQSQNISSYKIPVSPSTGYTASTWAKVDTACGDGFYLRVIWYDQWGNYLSYNDIYSNSGAVTTSWDNYSGQVTSAANAYHAAVQIYNHNPTNACTLYIDQVSLRASLIDADIAVNGDLLVGSLSETISQAGFSLTGDDLFVTDSIGAEGWIYSDTGLDISDNGKAAGTSMLKIGDDTFLTDVDVANTLGIYSSSDTTRGSIKLGSAGPTLAGTSALLTLTGALNVSSNLDVDGTSNDIAGTLNLSGNTLTSSGDLTIDAAGGGVKIGTGTPGIVDLAGDDLYVTGDLEVAGTTYLGSIDTSLTPGSVVFAGTSGVLSQDNTNFFWDDSANKLGIGDSTPDAKLTLGNNVATGFLDTFAEYQILLYSDATAGNSYGLGVKGSTMVFNTYDAYSWDRRGTTTSMTLDASSNLAVTGNIDAIGGTYNSANNVLSDTDATQPRLVLDSLSTGDNWTSQGAYISLGESGALGSAAMHITYTGDGYGYTGAGTVTSGIPAGGYWRYLYNNQQIYTPSSVDVTNNLTLTQPSATTNTLYGLKNSVGTDKGWFGIIGTAGAYITGSSQYDVFVRSQQNLWFAANAAGTADMMIESSTGKVGIGTTSPEVALDIEKATGNTFGKFGSSFPLYTVASNPTVGFNAYYNSGWKFGQGSTAHYGGEINVSPSTGTMSFNISNAAGAADGAITMQNMLTILQNGNIGVGTTAPDRALEINSSGGTNLRLTYNDSNGSATNYADLTTNSGGDLTINPSGGDISITSDRINFNTTGVAAPTFTNYSSGVKIVLYNDLSGSAAGYTLGIESGTMFSTVSTTGQQFKWYGGTTTAMTLSGAGALTLVGNLAVNGDNITTDGSLTISPTTTLTLNSTGDMTLDSSGDIILDAAGDDVIFKDNGTTYATITNGATNTTFTPLSDGLFVNGSLGVGIAPSSIYRTYFYNQGTDATSKSTSRVLLQNICTSVACSGQYLALDAAAENHSASTQNTTGSLIAIGGTIGNSDTGTVAGVRGLSLTLSGNSGTITNTYGVYIGDLTAGTQTNTPYSIYSSDAGTYNYFAGEVGVGTASPNGIGGGGIMEIVNNDASTNTALTVLNLTRSSTGTAADGIGARLEFNLEDDGSTIREAATINALLTDSSNGSIDSALTFNTRYNQSAFREVLRLTGNSLVGLGTTNPTSELYVTRALSAGTTGKSLTILDQIENQDIFAASSSGTSRFVITNAGKVGINNPLPSGYLSIKAVGAGAPTLVEGYDTTTGTNKAFTLNTDSNGNGSLDLYITGSKKVHLVAWGGDSSYILDSDFGLGTTTPKAKLDVAGSASISGNLAYSGGTNNFSNYVLNGSKLNFMVSPGGTEGNGDIGDGFSTANQSQLPQALNDTFGSITSASVNGTTYIYSLGGQNSGGTSLSTVYKSRVDATFGNAGTFSSTANALPGIRWGGGATTATIGSSTYVYLIGGSSGSVQSTAYYATLSNSDGNPGTFATTSPILATRLEPAVTTATVGGTTYIYAMGGFNSTAVNTNPTSTVYKATVNSNGTLGTFSTTSPLLANRGGGGAVSATIGSSTYVYYVGGGDSQGRSTVYKAAVNPSNGTLGTFSSVTGLPMNRQEGGTEIVTLNDKTYIYSIGSGDNNAVTSSNAVYKTALDSSGNPGTWSSSGQSQLPQNVAYIGTTLVTVNGNSYIFAVGGSGESAASLSTVYRAGIGNVALTIANNGYVGIGTSNPGAQLAITWGPDVSLSNAGTFIIGDTGGQNVGFDNNELQARLNGTTSKLWLNNNGGEVGIGAGGLDVEGNIQLDIQNVSGTFAFCHGTNGAQADSNINDCNGSATDIAEYYPGTEDMEPGDLVSLVASSDARFKYQVVKPTTPYDQNLIGVVSTIPTGPNGDVLGDSTIPEDHYPQAIGLAGRVVVKVSLENGPIRTNDYLTSSSVPGVAMKATKSSRVVGRAIEDYDGTVQVSSGSRDQERYRIETGITANKTPVDPPTGIGKILMFTGPTLYDPDVFLTSAGNLNLVDNSEYLSFDVPHTFTLNDPFNLPITRIGAFAEIISAKITAGFIKAEQISTKSLNVATANVSIAGQSLHDYIASIVAEQLSNISNLTSNSVVSPIAQIDEIHTNVISPVGESKKVAVKLNDNQGESKLEIQNASGSALASFDSLGNASISGNLSSNNLLVNDNATVSGVLRASKIIADEIEGLNIKTSTIAANYITNNYYVATPGAFPTLPANNSNNSAYQIAGDYINIASYSSQLARISNLTGDDAIFNNTLTVFGQTTLADTSIIGQLAVGGNLIIADEAINVLGGDLNLQPLRQGGLSIMAGLIHIDTNGNATFESNATIKGTLYANQIAPLPGKDLNIKLASNSADTNSLVVKGASGAGVLAINNLGDLIASGEASFAKLNINNIVGTAYALSPTEVVASGSAGTVTLKALKTEVTVNNKLVTPNSLIYITPLGSTASENIYLMRQVPGKSFTVGISNPISQDVKFNFLIVN